jgi:Uncharacterized protein conserved in bacteria
MKLLWDEPKRLANIDKHGLDFADLDIDFFATALVVPAKGPRYMAIGHGPAGMITVVFAPLGTEALSIISMRSSSATERRFL